MREFGFKMKDQEQVTWLCYAGPIKYNSDDGPATDVVSHVPCCCMIFDEYYVGYGLNLIGVNFLKKIQIELVSIHKPCKFYS